MGFLSKHIHSLNRLEARVKNQEIRLEEVHKKAEQVLNELKALENLIIKNYGEKQGDILIEKSLRNEMDTIHKFISFNQFDEAASLIKEVKARVLKQIYSHTGVAYQ